MDVNDGTARRMTRRQTIGLALMIGAAGLAASCAPGPAPTPSAPAPKSEVPQPTAPPKAAPPAPTPQAAPAKTAAPPKAADKVTLQLDYLVGGHHAPFFVARQLGYYKEAGLDVEMIESQGSNQAIQLLGTKKATFGFADGSAMAKAIAQDAPVKMVAGIIRKTSAGLASLKETGIRTPKDLEGKTLGAKAGTSGYSLWPAFVKINNIDESKIRVLNIDIASADRLILSGQIDFTDGIAGSEANRYTQAGKEGAFLAYPDWGLNVVGHGIIVHRDLIKESPELIRRFVAPSLKGWEYARKNPDESANILVKSVPEMQEARKQSALALLKSTLDLLESDNTKGKPIGYQSEKDWESTINGLVLSNGLSRRVELAELYTNEFLPPS